MLAQADSRIHQVNLWGRNVDNYVKAALIIGASIIIAVAINIYFSPFQTCKRGLEAQKPGSKNAGVACAIRTR